MVKFIKRFSFSFAIFLTFILIVLGVSLNKSNTVNATNGFVLESSMSPVDKIKSYAYYKAIVLCASEGQFVKETSNPTFDNIVEGDNDRKVSFLVDANDGLMECNEMAKQAFVFWGFAGLNIGDFLNGIGYTSKSSEKYICRIKTYLPDSTREGHVIVLDDGQILNSTTLATSTIYTDRTFIWPTIIDKNNIIQTNKKSDLLDLLPSGISAYTSVKKDYLKDGVVNYKDDIEFSCDQYARTSVYSTDPSLYNYAPKGDNDDNKDGVIDDKDDHAFKTMSGNTIAYTAPEADALAGKLASYIKSNIYKITDPSKQIQLSDTPGLEYYLYYYYFYTATGVCKATNYSEPYPTELVANTANSIDVINFKPGTLSPQKFRAGWTQPNYTAGSVDERSFIFFAGGADKTCMQIAKDMNAAAQLIVDGVVQGDTYTKYESVLGLISTQTPIIGEEKHKEVSTTCAIDGIGWLLCPVAKAMSKLVDAAYLQITQMLTTPALDTNTSNEDNSMYAMWKIMRTFANIAFLIAFLVIIFSQMTSFGVSNYGIKKMLPKLIIAAILVNLSYFMCAIAIDISNMTGAGVQGLLNSINKSAIATTEQPTNQILAGVADFAIIGTTGAAAVALTGGYMAALSLLLPGLIVAILAILTVFLVLTLRQALIILLVVVSPLALVSYILPNTESWFKKWKDLFITMLMMFPIISAVFAISKLASSIIISSANGHGMIALMGMFIQFIPLAITPLVLKSAGGVLNRFAGMVNNPNRGPFDAMKKGAAGYRNNRKNLRDLNALQGGKGATSKFIRWNTKRKAVNSNRLRLTGDAGSEFLANEAQSDSKFLNRLAGGTDGMDAANLLRRATGRPTTNEASESATQRALANALNTKLEIEAKEVRAASAIITNMNLSVPQKQELAKGNDVTTTSGKVLSGRNNYIRQAAIESAIKASKVDEVEAIIKSSGNASPTAMTATQRQVLVNTLISSGFTSKSPNLAGGTLGSIERGEINTDEDLDNSVISLIQDGKLSAEKVANSDITMLRRLSSVMNKPDIETMVGTDRYLSMLTEIETAQKNPTIANTMDTVKKDELHKIVDPTKP